MIAFTKYALSNLKSTGSIIRSSRFLAKRLIKAIPSDAKTVIELGAGDGIITKHILSKLSPESQLTAYEISPELLVHLEKISNENFSLNSGSALDIDQDFKDESVDVLVSCLPIALFPLETKKQLLAKIKRVLKKGGLFIQYQYYPKDKKLILSYFPNTKIDWVGLNAPPAFIYIASKH